MGSESLVKTAMTNSTMVSMDAKPTVQRGPYQILLVLEALPPRLTLAPIISVFIPQTHPHPSSCRWTQTLIDMDYKLRVTGSLPGSLILEVLLIWRTSQSVHLKFLLQEVKIFTPFQEVWTWHLRWIILEASFDILISQFLNVLTLTVSPALHITSQEVLEYVLLVVRDTIC